MINFKFIVIMITKIIIVRKLYSIFYKITYQVLLQKKNITNTSILKLAFQIFKIFSNIFLFSILFQSKSFPTVTVKPFTLLFFETSNLLHLDN